MFLLTLISGYRLVAAIGMYNNQLLKGVSIPSSSVASFTSSVCCEFAFVVGNLICLS